MAYLLFVVGDSYMGGQGLTLVPGISVRDERPEVASIESGMELELRLPDGTRRRTQLVAYGMPVRKSGVSSFHLYRNPEDAYIHFLLPKQLSEEDVPAGTEVWILDDTEGHPSRIRREKGISLKGPGEMSKES